MKKGFTLIELAIVIVIIGLLVAGVLQGKDLIRTAELNSMITEIKSIESGIYLYRDKYNALPGDDIQGLTKFPGCTSLGSCINGDGSGTIQGVTANSLGGYETPFLHMVSAGTIKRNECKPVYSSVRDRFGSLVKGACYSIGYSGTAAIWNIPLGNFLMLAPPSTSSYFYSDDLRYIDTKIDDGNASNGKFTAYKPTSDQSAPQNCLDINTFSTSPAGSANYIGNATSNDCAFHYRFGF